MLRHLLPLRYIPLAEAAGSLQNDFQSSSGERMATLRANVGMSDDHYALSPILLLTENILFH